MSVCSLTDHELVADFLGGDSAAFSIIVQRYHTRLIWIARRYAHNDDDALDILQEALLRASLSLRNFRWESSLNTWLHRLVMNCGYDYSHRKNRETTILDDETNTPIATNALKHDPVPALETHLCIRNALKVLSPEHRDAIVEVDIAGYSIHNVAAHHGVCPGTIKSRRARAKEQLRKILGREILV